MISPLAVANLANLALGAFLVALAVFVARKSPDRLARGPLALFLALVGANYALDGIAFMLTTVGLSDQAIRYVALVPVFLDPPVLLLFSLVVAFGPLPPMRKALVGAPAVLIALLFLAFPPPQPYMSSWPLRGLFLAETATYYLLAFAFLVQAYLAEKRTLQRARLGTLVVAFGLVSLPRIPLLFIDFGIRASPTTFLPVWAVAAMIAILAGLYACFVAAGVRAADAAGREHAARSARALGGLFMVVATMWILLLVPPLTQPAYAMVFSFRWFLFAAVISAGVRQHDLLDLSEAAHARIRAAFTLTLFALAVAQLAAVLLGLPGATLTLALGGSLALVFIGAVGFAALRQANPQLPSDVAVRRATLYRAHVELGTDPVELEALRARLGIAERDAREIEALVSLEKRAARPTAELAEGATALGRYDIRKFLGAGSFGRAFLAWDRLAEERVVVKELLAAWRQDAEALERFRREAEVALRVSHPNLVGFRALEPTSGGHLLVLEYVEGQTLRERLAERGRLSSDEAAQVARDALAALGALHASGIVHRDVKPENIVLRPDGRAVLLDFGAATHEDTGTRLAGANPGTRAYMAPEQARGERCGPASDLYSLGATLAEALGAMPDAAWRPLLDRALAADPAQRWSSAAAFANALPPVASAVNRPRT